MAEVGVALTTATVNGGRFVSDPQLEPPSRPVLRVITPGATEEEVAALVAVLSSLDAAVPAQEPVSEWAAPHRRLRRTYPHGPGGWRASALPR